MTKASENEYPKVTFAEGAAPGTPAAGLVIAYAKTDGLLYSKDDAGAETALGGGGSGNVATDAIWDAAGDLAVGTGENTAARLAIGTNGKLVGASGGAVAYVGGALVYAGGPITSPVTMTNSAQWYDSGAEVTLPAGTYVLWGTASIRIASSSATSVMARLIDTEGSPTTYSGGTFSFVANASQEIQVAIMPKLITIAGTRTIKLQCQDGARTNSVIVDTGTGISPGTDIQTGFVALACVAG